jgi:ribosomal protein S18 acetylase RimI-like enzyme
MSDPEIHIERVPPEVTRPLRQRLLMGHRTLAELEASDGTYPEAAYFVAMQGDEIIATASARQEAPPWSPHGHRPWRIRGVVTVDRLRRQGLATQLVDAVLAHVRRQRGDFVWCNVRTSAIGFYESLGLKVRTAVWQDPDTGPHVSVGMRLREEGNSQEDELSSAYSGLKQV